MKRYLKIGTSGFTLLELMVAVAIIAFVAAMGIPAWWKMQPHLRLKTASRDIANMLHQARMYSVAANTYSELAVDYTNETVKWRPSTDEGTWSTIDPWVDIDLFKPDESSTFIGTGDQKAENPTGNHIMFRPDGTSTVLGDQNQQAIYIRNQRDPDEYFRVRVSTAGIIKVEKIQNDNWD